MRTMLVLTLLLAPVFAQAQDLSLAREKVLTAFANGCGLGAASTTIDPRSLTSQQLDAALQCGMVVKSALSVARHAGRINGNGVSICVPSSATNAQLALHVAQMWKARRMPHAMDGAEMVLLALADRYPCSPDG